MNPQASQAINDAVLGPHGPGSDPHTKPIREDGLWDIEAVAAYLRVPVQSIYKMTAPKGVRPIPHIRIGRSLRFRRADIDRWLALLTVSNIGVLVNMRKKVQEVTHGDNSQKEAR